MVPAASTPALEQTSSFATSSFGACYCTERVSGVASSAGLACAILELKAGSLGYGRTDSHSPNQVMQRGMDPLGPFLQHSPSSLVRLRSSLSRLV